MNDKSDLKPLKIFADLPPQDPELLARFEQMADPRRRYIIAMTPRSGSSYLCDVLLRTRVFGKPGERLNEKFIPNMLQKIPATSADMYLRNSFRNAATKNGIAGFKASWFQFNNFAAAMENPGELTKPSYIYLYRRDSAQQAVSLYRATQTDVFHTNVEHSQDSLRKLAELPYDYAKIDFWHEHILRQERGWKNFFDEHGINPLTLTYEDIVDDIECVLRRMAKHVGVARKNARLPEESSVFSKIGDRTSLEWACRYQMERLQAQQDAR